MAGGFGLIQTQRFSTQPLSISGRRILSAAKNTTLPSAAKILSGAVPTAYTDHGSIVQGKVNVQVDITIESIDLGRIPSPSRYYISGQKGSFTASLQEYQPEMIDLAAGGTGVPTTASGYSQVYIGGRLGAERRVLVIEDFDVDYATDGFLWDQFWWTTPDAQAGSTFSLGEEKAQTVVPITYNMLFFDINGVQRLLEFRAINHS